MAKARFIAMYLPQYHPTQVNDEWWGPGFTEWTNVASAKPLFRGHYQPKIPADLGFYDLRLPETRVAQANLAREAGIEGFMYWHYWFGKGKRLLERPFDEVLKSGSPDYPFCLGWANHSWTTGTWTAKNKGIKRNIEQTYIEEEYVDHFNDVLPAFKDHRYITVDGKPFFLIYDPLSIPDLENFMSVWRNLAMKNGLPGIHFVGYVLGHKAENSVEKIRNSGFDAIVLSSLFHAQMASTGRIKLLIKKFLARKTELGPEKYKYKDIIKHCHNKLDSEENVYPMVVPQFDRTPRSGKKGALFTGSTPDLFAKFLEDTLNIIKCKEEQHKIIMINAWNEWGEGMYLEPDIKNGHGYLNAIKNVLNKDL